MSGHRFNTALKIAEDDLHLWRTRQRAQIGLLPEHIPGYAGTWALADASSKKLDPIDL